MIGNTYSTYRILPVAVALLAGSVVHAGQPVVGFPRLVEVFTAGDSQITPDAELSGPNSGDIELQIYELDGIQHIELQLSQGLTADGTDHYRPGPHAPGKVQ